MIIDGNEYCIDDTVPISEIPLIMRMPLKGEYCSMIDECTNCNRKSGSIFSFNEIIGVGTDRIGQTQIMWECPHCFSINRYHLRQDIWSMFQRTIYKEKTRYYEMEKEEIKRI